ncbi:hypothetical protein OsJ_15371 [Oryza sativa Japonica Group]|uniref:Uncharacterized protein n=1 Tax=Oryza sativa subsp. japonica TaxID=39947 RepID=B9FG03_ORYSJ|nr:hypothetical protein OsJ_15371 [Oryza sativa Japonica Group]
MNSAAETETEGGGGAAAVEPQVVVVERVVTVEYLEPSMSRGLLGMFPDSSAFDFDYSQSGIWSPLNKVPRASSSPPPPPRSGGGGAEGSRDFLIANPKRRARAAIGGRSSRSRRRRLRLRREDGSFLNLHETGCARLGLLAAATIVASPGQGGRVEAGAQGGDQEVQIAAAPIPAGSPAPDDAANAMIDRSTEQSISWFARSVRCCMNQSPRVLSVGFESPAARDTPLLRVV